MSDMRIQNLLQSMAQGRGAHKGDYTLSDVRFDLSGDALSSSLKNYYIDYSKIKILVFFKF